MDGLPLRYLLMGDGHFILYSVGLDCVDNGGTMQTVGSRKGAFPLPQYPQYRVPGDMMQDTDLVWPRPASPAEVKAEQEKLEREVAR